MVQIPMEALYRLLKNEKVRANILYIIYKGVMVLCEQNVNTVDFCFSVTASFIHINKAQQQ